MATTAAEFFNTADGLGITEIIILTVIIGLGSALFQWMRKRRNTPRYEALAEQYGGTYTPRAQARADRFAGTDWVPEQPTFEVHDYLTGSHQGHPFYCFGWEDVRSGAVSDGDVDTVAVNRSVYAMELPGTVGHFAVRRHSAARRMFGQRDVQVGHPEFDERFTVQEQVPGTARQVLDGPLLDFLLQDPRSKDYPLYFLGDRLVCSVTSRFSPDDAEPVLEFLARVTGHLGHAERAGGHSPLWEDVAPVGQ